MTIGKLAAAEGVGVETVRFYQRRGLLAEPERRGSGYREYSEADRSRLVFIRRARRLGFTVGEIADLLGPAEAQSTQEIAEAAQAKLASIDAQVRELMQLRCKLRQLVRVCEHGDGRECAALQFDQQDNPRRYEMSIARVVTDDTFEAEVLNSERPVIVEYWADWCGPCRQVAPVLDSIAADHVGSIDLVKINVDENPDTTRKYSILHVPTVSVFSGGHVVKQVIGARSKSALVREFGEVLTPAAV